MRLKWKCEESEAEQGKIVKTPGIFWRVWEGASRKRQNNQSQTQTGSGDQTFPAERDEWRQLQLPIKHTRTQAKHSSRLLDVKPSLIIGSGKWLETTRTEKRICAGQVYCLNGFESVSNRKRRRCFFSFSFSGPVDCLFRLSLSHSVCVCLSALVCVCVSVWQMSSACDVLCNYQQKSTKSTKPENKEGEAKTLANGH